MIVTRNLALEYKLD